jgi:hypothetical protein
MTGLTKDAAGALIRKRFRVEEVWIDSLAVRSYPEETVFIVEVEKDDLPRAAELGNALDTQLQKGGFQGFVTVRATQETPRRRSKTVDQRVGVLDKRGADLVALLTARARTSETQPSLYYVRDAAANVNKVCTRRHSLIFGRRGAGKTALLLEGKRRISEDGNNVVWLNLQTYRREPILRTVLWILVKIVDEISTTTSSEGRRAVLQEQANALRRSVESLLGAENAKPSEVHRLVPAVQRLVQRFCESTGKALYIFLDDVHYIARNDQPELLDILHSCVRDADAWLKIAAIRHFANWFTIDPPTGLQAGQDADTIDLDFTLQQPARAKQFLEEVLKGFARHIGIRSISSFFTAAALDRLVLAAGAVPRDYLVLAAGALSHARARRKKLVGKQDVTLAAGDIAQAKMAELEEDTTSSTGTAQLIMSGLQRLRGFCVADQSVTFFKVEFKDKENHPDEYSLLQSLMDVRLIHLVNPGVSDMHLAGERSEVYTLDLSQFSGERLRRHLKVLDFEEGHMVLKETGTTKLPRPGDTPRRLITILRGAPVFRLENFTGLVHTEPRSDGAKKASRRKKG